MLLKITKKMAALQEYITKMIYNDYSDAELKKTISDIEDSNLQILEPLIFDLISTKRFSLLEYLYEKKIPFTYSDASGANSLHVACGSSGSLEAVKFLFERNILNDINATTDENETPFILAIMYQHEDIVEYLLKHAKPNFNIVTIEGNTAISLAKKSRNKRILDLLEQQRNIKKE